MKFINYYKLLHLSVNSSLSDIKKAYHNLAKKCHPDIDSGSNQIYLLNEAYNVLSDLEKRAEYDAALGQYIESRQLKVDVFPSDVLVGEMTVFYDRQSRCEECSGKGSVVRKSEEQELCPICGGSGSLFFENQEHFNQISDCHLCSGTGNMLHEKCSGCNGEGSFRERSELLVRLSEIRDDRLEFSERGDYNRISDSCADLVIVFQLAEEPYCRISGDVLTLDWLCPVFDIILEKTARIIVKDTEICITDLKSAGVQKGNIDIVRHYNGRNFKFRLNIIPDFSMNLTLHQKDSIEKIISNE